MTSLLTLCSRNTACLVGLSVLLQVTIITAVALLLIKLVGRQNAARQHAIGFFAILVVWLSPLLSWILCCNGLGLISFDLPTHQMESSPTVSSRANTIAVAVAPVAVVPQLPSRDTLSVPVAFDAATQGVDTESDLATKGGSVIFGVVGIVWAIGAVWAFLCLVYGLGYQYAFCRTGRPLDGARYGAILTRVATRVGKAPATVLLSRLIDSPICVGLWRPRVILPVDLPERIDISQLEHVLVHEQAHIRRGDLWIGLIQRLAQITFWFHPMVYVLNSRIARAREEVCDNFALAGVSAADYAQTLVDVHNSISHLHAIPATAALMVPRWDLAQRIEGLLNNERCTMTQVDRKTGILTAASFTIMAMAVSIQASDGKPESSSLADGGNADARTTEVLSRFTRLKAAQIREMSDELAVPVPEDFADFLSVVDKREPWANVAQAFRSMQDRSGQYCFGERDAAISTPLWSGPMLELGGAYELFRNWNPELLELYGREVASVIPDGAVYFGGTDAGRFIVTAYLCDSERTNTVVVTQNALADQNYREYLRVAYGQDVVFPSDKSVSLAFTNYVKKMQAGEIPTRAGVRVENGSIQIKNSAAVMDINRMLAKIVHEENKDEYPFFVEESYPVAWMYPHLEPCGPIMRLRAKPTVLTKEVIARNDAYWASLIEKLESNRAFGRDSLSQTTFAKLRVSIAGLYQKHGCNEAAEAAFKQAVALSPTTLETNMRFALFYVKTEQPEKAREILTRFITVNPAEAQKAHELLKSLNNGK